MNTHKSVVLRAVLIVAFGLSTSVALAQDPDNGKLVWEEQVRQCQRCHGPMGEGLWARPLSNSELTAEEWITQVRTPRQNMPTFSESQVTDEQITDMHAYITSLPEPASFSPMEANLPADAPEGQMLIAQKRCIACHTETGPINFFIDRGEVPTAEAVIAQLRSPKERMPSFSEDQVSDDEAGLIADFLAEQVSAQLAAAPAPEGDQPAPEGDQPEPAAEPEALPQSGGQLPNYPLILLISGVALLLVGLAVRKFVAG